MKDRWLIKSANGSRMSTNQGHVSIASRVNESIKELAEKRPFDEIGDSHYISFIDNFIKECVNYYKELFVQ